MPNVNISSLSELLRQDWYNKINDPRCPHDAWIEDISIKEKSTSKEDQLRNILIEIRLLNAYHTGTILFRYENVRAYSLNILSVYDEGNRGHVDWVNDTFSSKRQGLSRHQITFSSGAVITILFETLFYEAKWESEAEMRSSPNG